MACEKARFLDLSVDELQPHWRRMFYRQIAFNSTATCFPILMIAVIASTFGAVDLSSLIAFPLIAITPIISMAIFLPLYRMHRRRANSRLREACRLAEGEFSRESLVATLKAGRYFDQDEAMRELARMLREFGHTNLAIRIAPPNTHAPIEPLSAPIEPIPLRDDDGASAEPHGGPAGESVEGKVRWFRRLPRWVTLKRGWFPFAAALALGSLAALDTHRIEDSPYAWVGAFGVLSLFVAVSLLFARVRVAWTKPEQWLAVSRGLFHRARGAEGDRLEPRLFDRACGVLLVCPHADTTWHTFVADQDACRHVRLTPVEANFALRAWLSGIEPPSVASLRDLRPSGGERAVLFTGDERVCYREHEGPVRVCAISPNGRKVLTVGGRDHSVHLWDAASGRRLHLLQGHTADVRTVAFSPDGGTILTGSEDFTARLWDADTGRELHRLSAHRLGVQDVSFSPDGRFAMTVSMDKRAFLWDVGGGGRIREVAKDGTDLSSLIVSPDWRHGLVIGPKRRSYDLRTGTCIEGRKDASPILERSHVAFSVDSRLLFVADLGGEVEVTTVPSGRLVTRFKVAKKRSSGLRCMAPSPDGRHVLVSPSRDNMVRLWEVSTGRQVRRFEGHSRGVNCVAFSSDGKTIVTGSNDKSVRLWDVAPAPTEAIGT